MRFRLDLPDDCYIHDVFHVNRLKLHTDPAMSKFKKKTVRLGKEFKDSNRKYEVEKILDHDVIRGKVWFLVHWRGFDEVLESTWESRELSRVGAVAEDTRDHRGTQRSRRRGGGCRPRLLAGATAT